MFESENRYFLTHKDELQRDYANKFVVLQGENIKGSFDTIEQAYSSASQTMEPGTFAIKQVSPEERPSLYMLATDENHSSE